MAKEEDPKRWTWEELGAIFGPPNFFEIHQVAALLRWTEAEVLEAISDGRFYAVKDRETGDLVIANYCLLKRDHPRRKSSKMLLNGRLVERPRVRKEDTIVQRFPLPIAEIVAEHVTGQRPDEIRMDSENRRIDGSYEYDDDTTYVDWDSYLVDEDIGPQT